MSGPKQGRVTLDTLVEWLENNDRFEWVELEADDKGSLDDIVVKRSDGIIEVRQIKFSTVPQKIEYAWNWERLLDTKNDAKKSLLQKWYRTWERLGSASASVEPFLKSNGSAASDFILQPNSKRIKWDDIAETLKVKDCKSVGFRSPAPGVFSTFSPFDSLNLHFGNSSQALTFGSSALAVLPVAGTPSTGQYAIGQTR